MEHLAVYKDGKEVDVALVGEALMAGEQGKTFKWFPHRTWEIPCRHAYVLYQQLI